MFTPFAFVRSVTFISASGGIETTSGSFKLHTFNSNGSFVVHSLGSSTNTIEYLVVGGGGGGGSNTGGGGGGGQLVTGSFDLTSTGTFSMGVGNSGYFFCWKDHRKWIRRISLWICP